MWVRVRVRVRVRVWVEAARQVAPASAELRSDAVAHLLGEI